ncbi:MAG: polysaccharide deacetylase family protein [Actinomycetota bacterium]|nr:polysaccharide deacetylase family protein [Actinomycetota bacterium]
MIIAASLVVACSSPARIVPSADDDETVPCTTDGHTTTASTMPATAPSSTSTSTTAPAPTTTLAPAPSYPSAPVEVLSPQSLHVFSRIDTIDPVVFLTLDDGNVRDPRVVALLAERGATASLFLTAGPLSVDPAYFEQFIVAGGSVNSHTLCHPHLNDLSQEQQQAEICGMVSQIEAAYGSAGYFLRPPYGDYNDATVAAARSCGVRALILWRVTLNNGVIDTWGTSPIHAGDIILTHFRDDLYDNLVVLFAELDRLGLTVAPLEDYLPIA